MEFEPFEYGHIDALERLSQDPNTTSIGWSLETVTWETLNQEYQKNASERGLWMWAIKARNQDALEIIGFLGSRVTEHPPKYVEIGLTYENQKLFDGEKTFLDQVLNKIMLVNTKPYPICVNCEQSPHNGPLYNNFLKSGFTHVPHKAHLCRATINTDSGSAKRFETYKTIEKALNSRKKPMEYLTQPFSNSIF